MKIICVPVFLLTVLIQTCSVNDEKQLQDLKCDYLTEPLGIENAHPSLSWVISSGKEGMKQSAYQILVAGRRKILEQDQADFWDSGKILSDQTIHIPYQGKKLHSRQKVYWKVRNWDQNNQISDWSEVSSWEMGLLNPRDWQAFWIGAPGETDSSVSSPLFRKPFTIGKPVKQARAYISGLGYYELYLNGKKVSDHVLSPNQTNYDRRRVDTWQESRIGNMSTRVLYEIFDITEFLKSGENVAGVWLGGGWYKQNDRLRDTFLLYDTPRFISQIEIEFTDDSRQIIVSDESWKTHPSPLVHNGLHTGEVYDARREIGNWHQAGLDDSRWEKTVRVRAPDARLQAQISPPDRVTKTIEPVSITRLQETVYRFDLGQMISGWVQISVAGPSGSRLILKLIEELGPSYGQTDTYILSGKGKEIWEPRFTWHAFRYIDVTSDRIPLTIDNLKGRVVNTDVAAAGSFHCSNPLFNQISDNFRRTQLGNMHGGIPSDCPHRERRGYTGDGQIASQAAIYAFDMASFYKKWLEDITDAQNRLSGYVPNTAPYQDGGGGTAWGSAYVIIPWKMYLFYGDQEILQKHYAGMKKWLDYLNSQQDKNGILVNQGLGEWVPPEINELSADFVNSCYYVYNCFLMSKIAGVLEKQNDQSLYESWKEQAKKAINNHYFNTRDNFYASGRQGANVFPLGFDITEKSQHTAVLQNLIMQIEEDCQGHFDTGMLATPLLLEVLTAAGHVELAYTLMNQRDFPGFGYMIEKGATTIWETWQGDQSHSHPMFGSVCQWFYQALAGITPDEALPGFKHILIKPHPLDGLFFVNCTYRSPYGLIRSDWEIRNEDFHLNLTIPDNTTATVFLPAASPEQIVENGITLTAVSNIEFVELIEGRAVCKVGPGNYKFISKGIRSLLPVPQLSAPQIFPRDTLAHQPDSVLIKILSDRPEADIYYTLDQTEPTWNSYSYSEPFYVKKNAVVSSRVYKTGQAPGYIKKSVIHFVDPQVNGLSWRYYEGEWMRLPQFDLLESKKTGCVFQFGLDNIGYEEDEFALVFEGKIQITKSGQYTFYTLSNDGSCLYLDNQLVVNNDGGHGPLEKSGQIFLNAGLYPIKVTYFQAGGGLSLQVSYAGPGIPKQEIPANTLYR
jgi:alpha-L-rhamnosidase